MGTVLWFRFVQKNNPLRKPLVLGGYKQRDSEGMLQLFVPMEQSKVIESKFHSLKATSVFNNFTGIFEGDYITLMYR